MAFGKALTKIKSQITPATPHSLAVVIRAR